MHRSGEEVSTPRTSYVELPAHAESFGLPILAADPLLSVCSTLCLFRAVALRAENERLRRQLNTQPTTAEEWKLHRDNVHTRMALQQPPVQTKSGAMQPKPPQSQWRH
jgi:hypothetical protein